MLSIAIFSDAIQDMQPWKDKIQDFLIETETMAKMSCFKKANDLITVAGSYDVYVMDMDSSVDVILLGKQMSEIDKGSRFIYLSSNEDDVHKIAKLHSGLFVTKPLEYDEFVVLLNKLKNSIKEENVIIKTPLGERRMRISNFNYLDIVKRCLCYHLADGNMFDGQTLRTSFEKAIKPLDEHPAFLFLPPSLLINIGNVKEVRKDSIVFDSGDIVYISKKQLELISKQWHKYFKA